VVLDEAMQAAAASSDDPLVALHRRGRAYVRFGVDNPEHYRILFMSPGKHRNAGGDDWPAETPAFLHVVDAVQRCMDAGLFAADDPVQVALTLWAGVHGITALLISHPAFPWPPPDEFTDRMLHMELAGLLSDAGRAHLTVLEAERGWSDERG
jgi:Tetracyclin repressor-like, C-terminal domain